MLDALPPGVAAEMFRGLAPRASRDPAAAAVPQLVRLASLVQLIDYATIYLGIALGLDPAASPAIVS